jgi:hypothetical protein
MVDFDWGRSSYMLFQGTMPGCIYTDGGNQTTVRIVGMLTSI